MLLDLDDTILDDTGSRDRCWRAACLEAADRYRGLDAERLLTEITIVREWFWSDAGRHREWRLRMPDAWVHIARDALTRLGIDDPALAAFLGERHVELRDAALAPLPHALETLERLRSRDVVLGLITNGGSEGQRAKIERFALASHFGYIGVEGEVGFGKPHRVAYETALRHLGAEPRDAWMVGDNLAWDVEGAQGVGIRGIWVDRDRRGVPANMTVKPDRIIGSIGELLTDSPEAPTPGPSPGLRR